MNIAWDLAKGWTVYQIPSSLPPLLSGDRLVVYGVLKASENANEVDDNEVRLEGMLGNDDKVKHVVKFSTPPIAVENKTNVLLHQLAAKNYIQEKQDGYSERNNVQETEEAKMSTISISKSANVVSKFTSFVAVDKDSNQPVSGPLQKHFVPSYWSAHFSGPMAIRSGPLCGGASPLHPTSSTSYAFPPRPTPPMQSFLTPTYSALSCGPPANKKGRFDLSFKEWEGSFQRDNRFMAQEIYGGSKTSLNFLPGLGSIFQKKKNSPPVLALVTLQKAPGSWDLTDELVSLCGTSRDVLIKACPKEIAVDTGEGKLLWATALALVLLMGKFLDQKDKWEMIAEKGSNWMKKNLPAGLKYENVLEVAAATVGVQVKFGQ